MACVATKALYISSVRRNATPAGGTSGSMSLITPSRAARLVSEQIRTAISAPDDAQADPSGGLTVVLGDYEIIFAPLDNPDELPDDKLFVATRAKTGAGEQDYFTTTSLDGVDICANENGIVIRQGDFPWPFLARHSIIVVYLCYAAILREFRSELDDCSRSFVATGRRVDAQKRLTEISIDLNLFSEQYIIDPNFCSGNYKDFAVFLDDELNNSYFLKQNLELLERLMGWNARIDISRNNIYAKLSAFLLIPLSISSFASIDSSLFMGEGRSPVDHALFIVVFTVLSTVFGYFIWQIIRYLTNPDRYDKNAVWGICCALLAAIFSGLGMIFVKHFTVTNVPTTVITGTSYFYTAVFFIFASIISSDYRKTAETIGKLAGNVNFWICGISGGYFLYLYYYAVNYVSASLAELFASLGPLGTFVIVRFVYRERLDTRIFLISGLILAATYLLLFGFTAPDINLSNAVVTGFLFSLGGVFVSAFFKASQKYVPVDSRSLPSSLMFVGLYSLVSCAALVPLSLYLGDHESLPTIDLHTHLLLLVSGLREGLGWLMLFFAIRMINAFHANVIQNYAFVVTLLLDYILFNTILPAGSYVGIGLLVLIMVIVAKEIRLENNQVAARQQ